MLVLLSLVALAFGHVHHHHTRYAEKDAARSNAPAGAVSDEGDDVECEGFDTYALCPGGWPMIDAEEAKHRVKCCGKAPTTNCELCNRCKHGSFVDSCCTCDDDELVNAFWEAMHEFHHNPNTQADNTLISERQFINLIASVKGEMDIEEEVKIKDVYSNFLTHVQEKRDSNQEAVETNGLADSAAFLTYLRSNPDVVDHLIGENESPSEGDRQLALDHTKAVIPEWFSGQEGQWAGHLPPPIIRKTKNGLWEVLVPNFNHPGNGYLPAVYRHSQQEAKAYVDEKKAEHLLLESRQAHMTHNIRAKASEHVDLVHHDRHSDGHAGYKKYNDQTVAEQHQNLVGNANERGGTNNHSFASLKSKIMKKHGKKRH